MKLYRLCKAAYSHDLSGKGAAEFGGRWNSKGVAVLYTASSPALCVAEMVVHLPLGIVPSGFVMISFELEEPFLGQVLSPAELPEDWNSYPHPETTQRIGDQFVREQQFLALTVPSAIVPNDTLTLLNPAHHGFNRFKQTHREDFRFDKRLFNR